MMNASRILLSSLKRMRFVPHVESQILSRKHDLTLVCLTCKLSTHRVTKSIELVAQDDKIHTPNSTIQTFGDGKNRPLLVILSWLMSKRKHVMKFANLYIEQGFDVAMVTVTPWQLMWPAKGTRLIAVDILDFLKQRENYQQVLLHGFSVGAYMWGECLDLIQNDHKKYDGIIDRIVGQVWDSVADVSELSLGIPPAVFPKNVILQDMLQKYLEYHLKTFHKQSTQYYIRSSQLFHTNLVRSPALFFISRTDTVGALTSNMRVRDSWDSLGVKTYVKIFEQSPHVGHYQKYPKEYVAELYAFLNKLQLIQNDEKMRARL